MSGSNVARRAQSTRDVEGAVDNVVTYLVVDLPEPELTWRRQQIVRVLAAMLRSDERLEAD
jgi:hypothetical protein